MRFSPDGRTLAAAANLGVRLLDAHTLDPLPGGYLPYADRAQCLAFSPDGALLLTAHEDGSAQLWDVATRKPVGPPAVLVGPIRGVTFTPDGRTCVCVASDGTIRRWPVPVPFTEPDLTRLADRVALMTGQRMDDAQGLDYVPADQWRALRARLVGDGSTALVPPRPDADWHDARAADAEQDSDVYGVEWHLDRLDELRPGDWTLAARRGRVLAAAGRREEADMAYAAAWCLAPSSRILADWLRAAAADDRATGRAEGEVWNLDRALALTPDDWTLYPMRLPPGGEPGGALAFWATVERLWARADELRPAGDGKGGPRRTTPLSGKESWALLSLAPKLAYAGQDQALAATCRRALALAGVPDDPMVADQIAKLCCLRPMDADIQTAVLALARRAVEIGKEHRFLAFFQMALGMAEYRCGRYAEADAAFAAALIGGNNTHDIIVTTCGFYRAMSLFRQGKPGEARTVAAQAAARMKPPPQEGQNPYAGGTSPDDLIIWLAHREVTALLEAKPVPPPK
jgi:tetratricopeptide (TPR) repeat protein